MCMIGIWNTFGYLIKCNLTKDSIGKPRKVIEISGKTIDNLFLFKAYYPANEKQIGKN